MKTVTVIVPCYNEEAVINRFYTETRKVTDMCTGYVFEFLFVNDGSSDNTANLIKELADSDFGVKYISFSRNFGKEAAMLAGLEHANGDIIGIMDADLQHSPSMIPGMLKAVDEEGFDVAAAKRSDREGENGLKSVLSSGFYKIVNKISETHIDDGAQDFRFMKRKVAQAMVSTAENNRFTKGLFSWVGFTTKWFPHENAERAAGTSKWSLLKLVRYAVDGIIGYTSTPLRVPFYAGIFSFLAGLVYLIVSLAVPLSDKHFIVSWIIIVCGILLVCMGITGEYIARIYTEVKGRPKYIITSANCSKTVY